MIRYFFKRLLLIIPTLLAIMLINFVIIQTAPGGPIERFIAQINNREVSGEVSNFAGNNFETKNLGNINQSSVSSTSNLSAYKNGIDPEILQKIEKLYGFDLSMSDRFWLMIKNYLKFDFGESFYQDQKVIDLIKQKLPVSVSLGLWSIFLIYSIAIFLGIKKAMTDGSRFDIVSSTMVIILHAIPGFLLAIALIFLFCGGHFLSIFPLRGLVSSNFAELNWFQKIFDYLWHITLPVLSMTLGGFASLTFFCKNSFLEEIGKNYAICALAKGLNQKQVIYRHIFRNAMLIVIAGLPAVLLGVFFTSSMLIEVIFSLDGLGLLGYEAVISRDYPLMFANLYIFTLLGLLANLLCDLTYRIIDPRISFEKNS